MTEKKKKTGRKKIEIDWDLLDAHAVWASSEYCAEKLGVSNDTLVRRIKERYDMSFAEYKHKRQEGVRINLLTKQYEVAMRGDRTMLIWLGKQYLGQKENKQEEVREIELPKVINIVKSEKKRISNVQERTEDNDNSE